METESQKKAARDLWTEAQKVHRKLNASIEALAKDATSDWSHLEDIIAKHRLACVQILILDPEFFCKSVQGHMWSTHSIINNQYRTVLQRLRHQKTNVARSKLEKLHVRFLKTSFDFYKHYVQQLATKYGIPELEKAARMTNQTSPAAAADKVPVDELPPALKEGLLVACAMAIVHIGDLTRYLTQARSRKSKKSEPTEKGGDAAVSHPKPKVLEPHDYYNLASQLLPSLGHPYHQKGVMYLEDKNDFEVIFYFIKAIAVDTKHPMADQNLDQKFKLLRTSEATTSIASQDPTTILRFWFIRLHGGYFGDVPFTKQEAIEKEVLGRLRMAIQLHRDAQITLMKMVLINIAAHYIARTRLAENPDSKSAARTLYLVLRHNIQTFGAILVILKGELIEVKHQIPLSDLALTTATPDDQARKRSKGTTVQYVCMPLVRLYSSWLVATRDELDNAAEDLGPGITEMCTHFASVLTLFSEIYGGEDMKITPYLLPEDMLARGLMPLSSNLLPPACELGFDQDQNVAKADWEEWDQTKGIWSHEQELMARTLDILLCGFNLTEVGPLAFKWTQVENGLKFHYELPSESGSIASPTGPAQQETERMRTFAPAPAPAPEVTPSDQLLWEASQTQSLGGMSVVAAGQQTRRTPASHEGQPQSQKYSHQHSMPPPNHQGGPSSFPQLWERGIPTQASYVSSRTQASPLGQQEHHRDAGRRQFSDAAYHTDMSSSVWNSKLATPYAAQADPSVSEATDYDFSENTAVMDMVNEFLQPPSNPSWGQGGNQSAVEGNETSYGMHSATANEVFNGLASKSPALSGNHSPRAFPGLPWNLVYEPSAASSGPAAASSRVASRDYGAERAQHNWNFPGSSDATFSATSSIYQSTPQNKHANAFNPYAGAAGPYGGFMPTNRDSHTTPFRERTRSSGMAAAGEYTDAYDDLVLRNVREDMAKEQQARSRFN
ncbi:hypothetical protein F5X68DRAFT_265874 [Plectosphaerella plurivora]|uniref:Nonsense-mediated mRNA decay factor n=1 Tax=Plectosphaerella plurivora TaxID=936078 RepID=A0A9P8V2A9_9PEZI|nr:hypothetical protein F5X68DRAFT_265874 [Plectosphaerella plurivora]